MKLGSSHSPEAKAKLSAFRKGKAFTTGTKRTPEQREKMRQAALRRYLDPAQVAIRTAASLKGGEVNRLPVDEKAARDKARSACKRMLRRILTMSRVNKTATTEALLGYSKTQLRAHLETQFQLGMDWKQRESFHIDHIVPVSDFFRRGIFDPAIINALTNLQVLTPEENRAKGNQIITIDDLGVRSGIHMERRS